jgi:hypothetical protein
MTSEQALSVLRSETMRDTPIRARWAMGSSTPGDVIWTTLALPLLISERLRGVMEEGGFSGWDVVPVELCGKMGEALPRHYFLCLRGRCGPIDYSRSKKVDKVYPGGVFPIRKGLYFDPATWDGSDVFMAPGAGFKFVVESVRDTLQKAKAKNLLFESLNEVELEFMK